MEPVSPKVTDMALLFVEDETEAREMLGRMLGMNYPGLKVYLAENGSVGVEMFRQFRPQIVLTDINMPVMNGITMARHIREMETDVTIVAVTAHSDTSYLLGAIEVGIDHYILKPVNYPDLFGVLDKVIEKIGLKRLVAEQLENLRTSEQRFLRIFQATPDLLSITSVADGSYLEANEAFLRTLGYRRSEVVGRRPEEVPVWGDDVDRFRLLQSLAEEGEVRDREVRLKKRDGSLLTGLISAEKIDLDGRPRILTLFKDISDRKRHEEDRARLAAIVESSDDAIIAADRNGSIVSWNAGAERMLGWWADEMKGRSLCFLAPPDRKDEVCQLQHGMSDGEPVIRLDSVFRRRDGVLLNVSLVMCAIKSADGSFAGSSCIARDVTERTRMEETIRHQAQHDALTDLPNRKLFMDFLALELAQARRNRKNLAVLFLDLDHFKQINDTRGHAVGDLLLQAVAQRLRRCVRESDTVARIGGDEFNVLMPDLTQTDDVGTVVGKIMGVFSAPFLLDNQEINATTSVGVSMFPVDGDTPEELVKKADGAMYIAKQTSGNSYQFYNDAINARTGRRQRMARHLREAVGNGELELVFQPQVRVDGGGVVGAEALLRWRHPEMGLLMPSQFLAIAEETGAIVPIGEWVIRSACALMKRWQERGFGFSMTVNLSNREFHHPNLAETAERALADTGLDPHLLELDITEKAIMENPNLSIRNMRQLAQLGVAFSVDDFGTGSSSLPWIKQLPIGRLKIDKSFIREIATEPNDLAVVSAMICMSHNLNMKVNAVGVESAEQLQLIRRQGCDEAQGDLIGKAVSAPEFEQLFATL